MQQKCIYAIFGVALYTVYELYAHHKVYKNVMQKMLHHIQFLYETYFSYEYKLILNVSVIHVGLAKGENALARKVAKLLVNICPNATTILKLLVVR